jgi:ELWxxDGT repeat protein
MVVFKNNDWFGADDSKHGDELWRSDGTANGTRLAVDATTGAAATRPISLVVAGGRMYFASVDPADGWEPWSSDGTTPGTHIVTDISPGAMSPISARCCG